MATIAVEMPAASAAPEQAEALLRACTIAAAPDRCEAADVTSEQPTAYAVVTWHGELAVRVEIGRPGAEDWLERRISFVEEDPPLERWQAVGFAIGTLFGAAQGRTDQAESEVAPPLPAEAAEPKLRAPTRNRDHAEAPAHTVYLGLLGRAGTGTESSARFGAGLSLSARHAAGPFAAADVAFDLAELGTTAPPAALSARFVSAGALIGTALSLSTKLRLDLGAGPLIEYQWMWTDQSLAAESRLVGAVRANVTLAHRIGSRMWLGVGAQMGSRFGDTTITLDDERVDSVPLVFASATVSLGFDLWRSSARNGTANEAPSR